MVLLVSRLKVPRRPPFFFLSSLASFFAAAAHCLATFCVAVSPLFLLRAASWYRYVDYQETRKGTDIVVNCSNHQTIIIHTYIATVEFWCAPTYRYRSVLPTLDTRASHHTCKIRLYRTKRAVSKAVGSSSGNHCTLIYIPLSLSGR